MSQTADVPAVALDQGLVDGVREQFSTLLRLVAVADPQPWMNLDLTMPQFKVLLLLWHAKRARVGVLAERLGVHISNISGILDRLVESGFVCREEDAGDRRLVVSRLTPKGEATLGRLYDSRAASVAEYLERLSSEELTALYAGLEALLARW
ncbi:MAG TPA: MarR family transcriptional regulator [Chloroflexota bacterium]|nr:MarR family transcriptional regulator [Chloroflexota bacterium]